MRVAVFGATGRLGQEVVRVATDRCLGVIAHARRPGQSLPPRATWTSREPALAVEGCDCVFLTFGPRSPSDPPFCATQTKEILDAMRQQGLSRILCVTGAMIGHYPQNRTWVFEQLAVWIQRRYREMMEDRAQQEELIRNSGLDWSIFKPPRLTVGKPVGASEVGPAVRVGLLSSISRSGLARLLVEEAERNLLVGQCVFVKVGKQRVYEPLRSTEALGQVELAESSLPAPGR